jgi:hypothetical protein
MKRSTQEADVIERLIGLGSNAAIGRGGRAVMADDTAGLEAGKPRKRQSVKMVTRQAVPKVKSTIHLSCEADKRLSVHATMMDMDRSELVESLINQHLRRYVVSDRGGAEGAAGEAVA